MAAQAFALLAAILIAIVPAGCSAGDPDGTPIGLGQLPREVAATLERIDRGGPFPYRQDGNVFHNREGRLPARPAAYYREYTVATPGARDRGPRRVVRGADGEYYYSDDHYRSFRRIRP